MEPVITNYEPRNMEKYLEVIHRRISLLLYLRLIQQLTVGILALLLLSPEPAGWKAWRYVEQTFLSAGSGDFPVARPSPTSDHTRCHGVFASAGSQKLFDPVKALRTRRTGRCE